MKQEEKSLLLQDLSARLLYGVKVEHLLHAPNNPSDLFGMDIDKQLLYCDHKGKEEWYKVDFIKPYLRQMSNMTEEERRTWKRISIACPDWNFTARAFQTLQRSKILFLQRQQTCKDA